MKKTLVIVLILIILAMFAGCTEQQVEEYKAQHPELMQGSIPTAIPVTTIPTPMPATTEQTVIPTTEPTVIESPTPNETPTATPTETPAITPTETQTQTPVPTETVTPTQTQTAVVASTPTQVVDNIPTATPELSFEEQIRAFHPAYGSWVMDFNPFVSGNANFQVTSTMSPTNGYPCGYGGANIKLADGTDLGYDSMFFIVPSDNADETKYSVVLTLSGGRTSYDYYMQHTGETMTVDIIYKASTDKLYLMFDENELTFSRA